VVAEADGVLIDEHRFPGRQGRLLFAYLVAEQGRPVPREQLAEALWGESPPATWDKALTVLVSKLRALLSECGVDGSGALTSAFGCYRLDLPHGTWVDIDAATRAVADAEAALAARRPGEARSAASGAEPLVREPFLPGDEGAWADAKRRELAEVRLRAMTVLADACLQTGDARASAKWAADVVELEPFRESGYRQLMEAHIADGNRAEALRVYERCRRLLADELGTYPSPETEALYRRLLEQTTEQDAAEPASADGRTRARSRVRLLVVAAAVVLAAAVVAGIYAAGRSPARSAVPENSVVGLSRTGSIKATLPVGARPVAVSSAGGALWVANLDDHSVTRIDPSAAKVVRTIPVDIVPTALASSRGGAWVADGTGSISRIDPTYNQVAATHHLETEGPLLYSASAPTPALAAFGSLWAAEPTGFVAQLDPATLKVTASADVGNDPAAIAAGAGSVWVANSTDGTVTRIDPATLVTTTIEVGHSPISVAVNAAGAWVVDAGDDKLVRINPETNAVDASTPVGAGATAVLSVPGALWVARGADGAVLRLDPSSGKVQKTIHLGGAPDALAAGGGKVWVAVAPANPSAPTSGGTAHLTSTFDLSPLDPALDTQTAITYATCANLVTYPDEPPPIGSRIVPEVAEAVPAPTNHGTTYRFTIRPGFRFSPPSNEPVTAATFKATLERLVNPRLESPLASLFSGIDGVVANGRQLTIRLKRADGAFLSNLAAGALCAVPRGTPAVPGGLDRVPSAGPYYIASYTPRQQLVLKRNPNYHGERPHRFDQFVITIGVDSSDALSQIEAGKADYALDGLPRDAAPMLERKYGPDSRAAKEGHPQYFISPANGLRILHMNTSRPLFSRLRVRRAVSYALDRRALVAQGRRFAVGNPFNAGAPTDDFFTPATAGAVDFHSYPLNGPDLRTAKRLAGNLHATAVMYTPNVPPWLQEAQIVRDDLQPLGIDVQIKEFPIGDFFRRIGRRGEPFDLAVAGWFFGGTDPGQGLIPFDGRTIRASGNQDFSYFDSARFDRQLSAAARLSGPQRYREYDRLELELERDFVPAAPFATAASRDFFSARVGCQVYQPVMGIDLAALCLRRPGGSK
jgi:YVTN family beta-propeller protein